VAYRDREEISWESEEEGELMLASDSDGEEMVEQVKGYEQQICDTKESRRGSVTARYGREHQLATKLTSSIVLLTSLIFRVSE
jgi:hypothetical protein